MVRTSDMMVYGLLAMVFLGVIYITTVHFFAPTAADEAPHDHPPLKETGGSASGIISKNIANILASRPSLPSEPPIAENMNYKNLYNVLADWNPDNPDVPAGFSETLHHFDYGNLAERAMAEKFRNAELPFKLFNVSEFAEVANLWTDNYLHDQLTTNLRGRSHVEKSKDNHFMYWNGRGRGRASYKPPTEIVDMDFDRWLKIAKAADEDKMNHTTEHYYFMSSCPAQDQGRTFISKDLKAFSTQKNNFFITNVVANKGIQCRFGMRGVIAESHYDSGRNMVAMLKGEKRYILNPPWACKHLGIIADKKHPSYRHSIIDWSDLQQAASRGFAKVDAIDTILRTGEVLYIPTYWFHYMVSLKYSIQCNSRSGLPPHKEGANHVNLCMRE